MDLFRKKKSEAQIDATSDIKKERLLKEAEQQEDEEQLQLSYASSEDDGLWQMSMPELWKMATSLRISKKGRKEELIERILDAQKSGVQVIHDDKDLNNTLEQLRNELREYEGIREEIKTKITSTSELIPKLDERKGFLKKDIDQMQQRIVEVTELFPKLKNENESLQKDIQEKLRIKMLLEKEITERRGKIEEITNLLPKLKRNKEDTQKSMQHNQEEISKIDIQIKQIQEFQKYSLDLLNTPLYVTE
jgi:chromosome segregation ATPase